MLIDVNEDATAEVIVFPRAGVAARRWRRFEHEYRSWLEGAEGQFALWRATRELHGHQGTVEQPAGSDRR